MSLITEFLKLFKSDDNTSYNQETMLNENWDKIDVKAKAQSEQIENLGVGVTNVFSKSDFISSGVSSTIGANLNIHLKLVNLNLRTNHSYYLSNGTNVCDFNQFPEFRPSVHYNNFNWRLDDGYLRITANGIYYVGETNAVNRIFNAVVSYYTD